MNDFLHSLHGERRTLDLRFASEVRSTSNDNVFRLLTQSRISSTTLPTTRHISGTGRRLSLYFP